MKRSNRLVAMTNFFYQNPRVRVQLPYFSKLYNSSKSSISEDLDIIDAMFKHEGVGYLQRISGASGGVMYIPYLLEEKSKEFIIGIYEKLVEPYLILPDVYYYFIVYYGDFLD